MPCAKICQIECTEKFLAPLVFLHRHPFFYEILGLGTDLELQTPVQDTDILEKTLYPNYFLAGLQLEMAESEKAPSRICHPFEIFDIAKLLQQSLHCIVRTFLRYILDEHLLPDFLFGTR